LKELKLSKDETLQHRVAHELINKRLLKGMKEETPTTPTPEDIEKYMKMSDCLNTQELADVF